MQPNLSRIPGISMEKSEKQTQQVVPVPGHPMLSPNLNRHQAHTRCTHKHVDKTLTQIKINTSAILQKCPGHERKNAECVPGRDCKGDLGAQCNGRARTGSQARTRTSAGRRFNSAVPTFACWHSSSPQLLYDRDTVCKLHRWAIWSLSKHHGVHLQKPQMAVVNHSITASWCTQGTEHT